jgi:hypothetical protein
MANQSLAAKSSTLPSGKYEANVFVAGEQLVTSLS